MELSMCEKSQSIKKTNKQTKLNETTQRLQTRTQTEKKESKHKTGIQMSLIPGEHSEAHATSREHKHVYNTYNSLPLD